MPDDLAVGEPQHRHRHMLACLGKTRVIPTFCAITPERIVSFLCPRADLDIDAGRKIELHQRIDRLGRRINESSSRLWVRISNCSRLFLSTCGERFT